MASYRPCVYVARKATIFRNRNCGPTESNDRNDDAKGLGIRPCIRVRWATVVSTGKLLSLEMN